jgi:hypothetical protein
MQQRMAQRGIEVSSIQFEAILHALQKKDQSTLAVGAIYIRDMITLRACVRNTVREINEVTRKSNKWCWDNKTKELNRKGWGTLVEQVNICFGCGEESIAVSTFGRRQKFVAQVEKKAGVASRNLCVWVEELVKQLQGNEFEAREINLLWSKPGATHQAVHMDMCAPAAGADDTGISLLLPIGSREQYLNTWPESNHLSQAATNHGFNAFTEFEADDRQKRLWSRALTQAYEKVAYEKVSIAEGNVAGFLPHLIHSGFKNDSDFDLLRIHVYVLPKGVKKKDNYVMPVPDAVMQCLAKNADMTFMPFSEGEAMDKGNCIKQQKIDDP